MERLFRVIKEIWSIIGCLVILHILSLLSAKGFIPTQMATVLMPITVVVFVICLITTIV